MRHVPCTATAVLCAYMLLQDEVDQCNGRMLLQGMLLQDDVNELATHELGTLCAALETETRNKEMRKDRRAQTAARVRKERQDCIQQTRQLEILLLAAQTSTSPGETSHKPACTRPADPDVRHAAEPGRPMPPEEATNSEASGAAACEEQQTLNSPGENKCQTACTKPPNAKVRYVAKRDMPPSPEKAADREAGDSDVCEGLSSFLRDCKLEGKSDTAIRWCREMGFDLIAEIHEAGMVDAFVAILMLKPGKATIVCKRLNEL